MRTCPICHATYEDLIDFCFKDGAPLEASAEAERRAAPPPSPRSPSRARVHTSIDRLSEIARDDLMPPEAISLVDLPVSEVFPEEEAPSTPSQWVRDESVRAAAGASMTRAALYKGPDDISRDLPSADTEPSPDEGAVHLRPGARSGEFPRTNPKSSGEIASRVSGEGPPRPSPRTSGEMPVRPSSRPTTETAPDKAASGSSPSPVSPRSPSPAKAAPAPSPARKVHPPLPSTATAPEKKPEFADPIYERMGNDQPRKVPWGMVAVLLVSLVLTGIAVWMYSNRLPPVEAQPVARTPQGEGEGIAATPTDVAPPESTPVVAPDPVPPPEEPVAAEDSPPVQAPFPAPDRPTPDRPVREPRVPDRAEAATRPTPAPAPVPVSPAPTPTTPSPWGDASPAPAVTPAAKARLTLLSKPIGVDVYIDGSHVGQTPVTVDITSGTHRLRAVKDGFPTMEDSLVVEARDGEAVRRMITMAQP